MAWIVRLVKIGTDGKKQCADALKIKENRLAVKKYASAHVLPFRKMQRTWHDVREDREEKEQLGADPDDGSELDVRVLESASWEGVVPDGQL